VIRHLVLLGSVALALVAVPADTAPANSLPPKSCLLAGDRAETVRLRAADGIRLNGFLLGPGRTGVVLAHGLRDDSCEWLPFARVLKARGYRVLAFDFRSHGDSQSVPALKGLDRDVAAAARELSRRGAAKVFLAGSSMGATAVLVGASVIGPAVAGTISLSAPATFVDLDAVTSVRRLRTPVLLLATRDEFQGQLAADARGLYRAAAVNDKRLVIRKGTSHGVTMLEGRPGAPVRALVLDWLRAHSR
jgi:alpha-beta hydrolase superfamily lysophospholipase